MEDDMIRQWLLDALNRKRAEKHTAIRSAKRDRDDFEEAAKLIKPLLTANPGWKWGDALRHLHASGAALPPSNPYLKLESLSRAADKIT